LKNKKVLVLGDPHSMHTKKWMDGWILLGYHPISSGLGKKSIDNPFVFTENINSTGGNGLKYLKNILNFYKVLNKVNPHIINAHYTSSYGLIGALIKRKQDKLIIFLPGSDIMIDMNKSRIYSLVFSFIFSRADILVSVSETMTSRLLKKSKKLKSKILTQQYGVDIKLLDTYSSDSKNIDIVTNRQWKPNSNYPILLEAINHFSDKNIKLIGSDNSKYAKNILKKFKDLSSYSTGLIPYEKNLEFVGKSKIFISLTTSDGIPLSLIEAMYLGAIPIVSDIEPNREVIKDGVNGFIVLIEKLSLKNKIDEILNLNDIEISNIQRYNRKLVLEKFDFEKNFENLKRKINNLERII